MKNHVSSVCALRRRLFSFGAEAAVFSAVLLCFLLFFTGCKADDNAPGTSDASGNEPGTSEPYSSEETGDAPETDVFPDFFEIDRGGRLTFENYAAEGVYEGEKKVYYRFHVPLREHEEALPLLIYLHGLEEDLKTLSAMEWSSAGAFVYPLYNLENNDAEYAHYALIPITPTPKEGWWGSGQLAAFEDLIFEIIENYNIDPSRVYVMGLSMGGYTVCDLVNSMPPDTFAAAVPISGAVDMFEPELHYNTAFRIYHASDDNVVSVAVSRSLYHQLTEAGHPNVEYFEAETGGHIGPFNAALGDSDNFFGWLFDQRLPQPETE